MPFDWSSDVCSDRKSTRLNSSHTLISYAVFCFKKRALPIRSEEHTSEIQSHSHLVCCLLLEKKKRPSAAPASRKRASSPGETVMRAPFCAAGGRPFF